MGTAFFNRYRAFQTMFLATAILTSVQHANAGIDKNETDALAEQLPQSELFLHTATIRCASEASEEGEGIEIEMKAAISDKASKIHSIRANLVARGETGTFTRSISVEKALAYAGESEGRSMWISERNYGPRFRQVLVEMPSQMNGKKSVKAKTTLIENRSVLLRDVDLDCSIQ